MMPFTTLAWVSIFGLLAPFSLGEAVLSNTLIDLATPHSYSQDTARICPLPTCEKCKDVEQIQAPGIGFALETSHGAAAVKLYDGTLQQISLIEGDASYTSLLRRLATGPMNRTPTHFTSNWEKLQYAKKRAQRLLNKALGRPATPESAIIADMVSALRTTTEAWLGGERSAAVVTAAVLSSPDRVRLTAEEINDVFDQLKLKNLMAEPDTLEDLHATSAAYAGYGQGLCATYTDAYACEREEQSFPPQRVLHINFNREALSCTIKSLQSARDGSVDATFIDPDLGHAREEIRLAVATEGDGSLYWAAISTRIRELVVSFKPRITQLLLTGPSATDARFKTAVREALHGVVAEGLLAVLDREDDATVKGDEWKAMFEYATARGAAEIAKRRQEGPVRCVESDDCKRRRERERQRVLQNQGTNADWEL